MDYLFIYFFKYLEREERKKREENQWVNATIAESTFKKNKIKKKKRYI